MPILLTHLGEEVVARMANRKPMEFLKALGLDEGVDPEHVKTTSEKGQFATAECPLAKLGDYGFDGASRVDVALWIKPNRAVALELKLGTTRLTKTRIDKELLADCQESGHKPPRISGSMMAILDRRFSQISEAARLESEENGLAVRIPEEQAVVTLGQQWYFVTLAEVRKKWKDAMPAWENAIPVTINDLVAETGGRSEFNAVVADVIPDDFYADWLQGT